MAHDCSMPVIDRGIHSFDARGIAKRFRHAAIFGALEACERGEPMRFYNDHDPLPLLSQINKYFGSSVDIVHVSEAPNEVVIEFRLLVVENDL